MKNMGTLKQWLGWIVFHGIIPSAAFLEFAQHMQHNELAYYFIGAPPLLLYFFIVGKLGIDVPGTITKTNQEDAVYSVLTFKITAGSRAGKVIVYIRSFVVFVLMPILGVGLIYYAVRDGEKMGYFLGPAMIWCSGGFWALTIQFFDKIKREARQSSSAQKEQ